MSSKRTDCVDESRNWSKSSVNCANGTRLVLRLPSKLLNNKHSNNNSSSSSKHRPKLRPTMQTSGAS